MTTAIPGAALSAVNSALALLNKHTVAGAKPRTPNMQVGMALRWFSESASHAELIERLDAVQKNPVEIITQVLDWHVVPGDKERSATKTVIKAIDATLRAVDENGNSCYPQAVEMLGYAAVLAPLLPADRLARVIAEAPKVKSAYAPCTYPARFFEVVQGVFKHFQQDRIEKLAISLWHESHEGRFWEIVEGVTVLQDQQLMARRRNEEREARAAAEAMVRDILGEATTGTPEAHARVQSALVEQTLPYTEEAAALVAALPYSIELADALKSHADTMRKGVYTAPDRVVFGSVIPWAAPNQRPESPIGWIVRQLLLAITPSGDGGDALIEELPKKPKKWRDLFPRDVVTGFPLPRGVVQLLDNKPMPGFEEARCQVIKDSVALEDNASYMGNCTKSIYGRQQEEGTYVLLRLNGADETWNISIVWRGERWTIGEVNSRHNRGNVPPQLREAANALVALPEIRNMVPRAVELGKKIEPNQSIFSIM